MSESDRQKDLTMKKKDNFGNRRRRKWNNDLQLAPTEQQAATLPEQQAATLTQPHPTKESCRETVMDINGLKQLTTAPNMDTTSAIPMTTVEIETSQADPHGFKEQPIRTTRGAPTTMKNITTTGLILTLNTTVNPCPDNLGGTVYLE